MKIKLLTFLFLLFFSGKTFAGQGAFLSFQNHYDPELDRNKGINYSPANVKCLNGLNLAGNNFLTNVLGYYIETDTQLGNGCLFLGVVPLDIVVKDFQETIATYHVNLSLNQLLTGGLTSLNSKYWSHGDYMSHGVSILGMRNTQDRIMISAAKKETVTSWMGQIYNVIKDRPINQLMIPGSHDSGTYDLGDKISPDSTLPAIISGAQINSLARTQYYSIAEQLDRGVRYLDIRLCSDGSNLLVCHSVFANTLTIESIFEQVKNFLDQPVNKNEVVIVDIQAVQNWDNFSPNIKYKIQTALMKYLGNYVAQPRQFSPESHFGDFVQSGKRAIVLQYHPTTSLIWERSNYMCGLWANSDNPDKIWEYFQSNIENRSNVCSNNKFMQSQLVYTIQGATIDNVLGNSLRDIVGPTKYNYLLKLNNNYLLSTSMRKNANIVIEDFTSGFDLALMAKWLNWSKKFFHD
ncbi:phosphatidylinositol-specific phospholipase C domain-containing protein [Fluviispira multicolorata]|uniref:1-phosphatidylinositol phosphodiesterase n=1 Tax=Fluviispira multicolorata TaxID=2654512 RepID=A0A833JFA0_9BACT|nr:phosphatidylinositol-specific phospholipase C domain-containing protein [Fluviispira multicolorata]KAB8033619.1 hypothetical protein GCL57_02615 [Fluviispira multicolorata]